MGGEKEEIVINEPAVGNLPKGVECCRYCSRLQTKNQKDSKKLMEVIIFYKIKTIHLIKTFNILSIKSKIILQKKMFFREKNNLLF